MTAVSRRAGWRRWRAPLTVIVLIGVAAAGLFAFSRRGTQAANQRLNYALVRAEHGPLVATVSASGTIQPRQALNLSFGAPDTVAAILVQPGQRVAQGAPLARLDDADLKLRLDQANATLAQAEASRGKITAGATPAEVAAAQAQLQQAQGQLQQAQGSVTARDIAAARAQLEQAQAALAKLAGGPKNADVQMAQAQLDQAQATLQTQRNTLSLQKTSAQNQIDQSVAQLTQAQARYASAKSNWDYAQDTGSDPAAPRTTDPQTGKQVRVKVSDAQRQQYYETFVQAEAAMRAAESTVSQAVASFDTARQNEITGIQAAQQQVTTAQSSLDKLLAGADADQLAAARAQVEQARANLAKLTGTQRAGSLQASEAGVANAEANLDRVTGAPLPADLAAADAQIASAQASVRQAELALSRATLSAPMAGYVATVNLKVGERPGTQPAVVLVDLSSFYVDVTVDEIDVARLRATQPVSLTLDALPGLELPGKVSRIDLLSTDQSAVTAYTVRIETAAGDERVRSGMSASADIVVDRADNALVVPRRALRADRGKIFVDVVKDQSLCAADPATRPAQPELTPVEVTTGLSNQSSIVVASGLKGGECVYVAGVDARFNPIGNGPPPGQGR